MKNHLHFGVLIILLLSLQNSYSQFNFKSIGEGQKPHMVLINDLPVISTVEEIPATGTVDLLTYNEVLKEFEEENIYVGSIYGPAIMDSNAIVLHDHGLNTGGAAVFTEVNNWDIRDASNEGHDGWDASIKYISENEIHVSYIDGSQFNGIGVEYSLFDGNSWKVDTVGTTQLLYGYRTSLEINSNNQPFIFYYNSETTNLELAYKLNETWNIDTLDSAGNVGFYCETKMRNDSVFLAYYENIGGNKAEVNFGILSPDLNFTNYVIDTINNLDFAEMGIIPVTIALGDSIKILASGKKQLNLYTLTPTNFTANKKELLNIATNDSILSLHNSVRYDKNNHTHICFGLKNQGNQIIYGTNAPTLNNIKSIRNTHVFYPNPVFSTITIDGIFNEASVLSMEGKLVLRSSNTLINISFLAPGTYILNIDGVNHKIVKK